MLEIRNIPYDTLTFIKKKNQIANLPQIIKSENVKQLWAMKIKSLGFYIYI